MRVPFKKTQEQQMKKIEENLFGTFSEFEYT